MFYVRMCVVGCLRISLTSRIGEDDEIVLLWCVSAESGLRALAVFARVFLCKMRDNSLPSHNPCLILSRPILSCPVPLKMARVWSTGAIGPDRAFAARVP